MSEPSFLFTVTVAGKAIPIRAHTKWEAIDRVYTTHQEFESDRAKYTAKKKRI